MSQPRPLPTTGRLSTRLSAADKSKLLSRLEPHLATPAYLKNPPRPLEVELGVGNGLALLARARANPAQHFLGCEVYLNGLRTLLNHLTPPHLPGHPTHPIHPQNLRLAALDARDLLAQLAPASVARLLIPFPDPWPKSKHHKRRLIQPAFLAAAARVLQPGGELWLVTDWPSYAYHTLAQLHAHPAFILAGTDTPAARCKVRPLHQAQPEVPMTRTPADPAALPPLSPAVLATPPAWWVETKYQQKAAAQNRHPWFIHATKA